MQIDVHGFHGQGSASIGRQACLTDLQAGRDLRGLFVPAAEAEFELNRAIHAFAAGHNTHSAQVFGQRSQAQTCQLSVDGQRSGGFHIVTDHLDTAVHTHAVQQARGTHTHAQRARRVRNEQLRAFYIKVYNSWRRSQTSVSPHQLGVAHTQVFHCHGHRGGQRGRLCRDWLLGCGGLAKQAQRIEVAREAERTLRIQTGARDRAVDHNLGYNKAAIQQRT